MSFVKVYRRVPELQTQTIGSTLGWSQFAKGHNSIKTVDGVKVLNHYILSDDASYLYQVSRKYLTLYAMLQICYNSNYGITNWARLFKTNDVVY